MVNATFTKKQGVFMGCQERMILVVFTSFGLRFTLQLSQFCDIFAGSKLILYKSIFSSSERLCSLEFETEKEVQCLKKTW